jgi:hypothetical protein
VFRGQGGFTVDTLQSAIDRLLSGSSAHARRQPPAHSPQTHAATQPPGPGASPPPAPPSLPGLIKQLSNAAGVTTPPSPSPQTVSSLLSYLIKR